MAVPRSPEPQSSLEADSVTTITTILPCFVVALSNVVPTLLSPAAGRIGERSR